MCPAIDDVDRMGQEEAKDLVLEQKSCVVAADGISKRDGHGHEENSLIGKRLRIGWQ